MISFLKRRKGYSQSELERALDGTIAAARQSEVPSAEELRAVSNIILAIKIATYDLNVLLDDSLHCKPGWRQKLYARMLVVNLAAFIDSYDKLIGKNVKSYVGEVLENPKDRDRLLALQQRMREIKRKHGAFLRSIRNVAIAHFDPSAGEQLRTIDGLDILRIQELAYDVIEWQVGLMETLIEWMKLKIVDIGRPRHKSNR